MAKDIVLGIRIKADGTATVTRDLGAMRDELGRTGNAANGANRQFAAMAREALSLNNVLKGLATALSVSALYQYTKEIVHIADEMKLLDGRLKVATSSHQDYITSQKELVAISLRTGTSFEANASMFARVNKSMEAMGGTARDTAAMTELIAKSLSISGTSAGEASSVIRQLSQAMASGVLRGDEFNSIMENGSRLAYALAAGMNVDVGALRVMAEAGELTSTKVIKAIMSQSAAINDEFSRIPLTVGAALENVMTAFGQYILQADAASGSTSDLASAFNALANNLGPVIDAVVTLGEVAATVFVGQMLIGLGQYIAAKYAVIVAERAHLAAVAQNLKANAAAASARMADINATQAAIVVAREEYAAKLQSVNAEIARTRATVAAMEATIQSTSIQYLHKQAVDQLSLAEQRRSVILTELAALGAQQTRVSVAATEAAAAQTAAQNALAGSAAAAGISMRMLLNPINLVNIAMAALVGWEIGTWLRSFQTVRLVAVAALGAVLQTIEKLTYGWQVLTAVSSGHIEKLGELKAAHDAEAAAIDANIKGMIDYEKSQNKANAATDELKELMLAVRSPQEKFMANVARSTELYNAGKINLDLYTKSLAQYHNELKRGAEQEATPFDKELAKLQDKKDKLTLSPRDYQRKQLSAEITDGDQVEQLMKVWDEIAAAEKRLEASKDHAKELESAAKQHATAEKNRRHAVMETIAALQSELEINRLGEQDKALQTELRQKLAKAVGSERDQITELVKQIHAENEVREKQKVSSDKAKSEMDSLVEKYNQLTLSARDYYAAKLKADGLSPEQSEPLLAQFDKNTALEASKKQTDDARSALDEYANSLKDVKKEMTGLGSVSSAVFDGALGGVNALSGAFSNMVSALQENTQALSTLREKQSLNELDKENKNYQKNVISFEKEAARLKQENLNASIDGIMQIAGASSKMFDQNSEEAKAMNLVVLGGLAAKAAAAMLTQGEGDPYTAFARIAAMGTLVAGIMSAAGAGGFDFSGGGSTPAPTGSSSTGTVLGDSEAKSASVNNTYELLQDIHAKEYATLRSIDQGIYNLQSGITDVITRLFQAGGINVPTIDGKARYAVDMQALNLTIGGPLGHMVEFAKKLPVIGGLISGIEDFVIGGLFGKTTRSVTGSGIGSNPTSLMDIMNGGDIAGYQYATIETKKKSWFSTKKSYSEQQMALDEATQDALTRVFKSMGQTMYGLAEQLGHDTKQKVESYIIPAMKVELHGLSGEDAAKKLNDVISASLDTMSEAVFGEILGQYQQLGEGMLETTTRIVSEIAIVQDALHQSGVSLTGDVIAISDAIVQAAGGLKEFQGAFEQAFDKFASDGAKLQRRIESLQGQLQELFPQSTIDRLAMGRDEYARLAGSLDQTNPKYAEQYAMLVKLAESADQYYSAMEDLAAAYRENQKTIEQLTTQYARLNGSDLQKQLWGLQDSFMNTIATIIANGGQLVDIMAVVDIALKTGADALEKSKDSLEKTFDGIFDAITKERLNLSDNILKLTAPDSLAAVQKQRALNDLYSDNYEKQMAAVNALQGIIMQGYDEQTAAVKQVADAVKQLQSYIDGLKVNEQLSPLSNQGRLDESRAQFSAQLALAKAGDRDALTGLSKFADTYLGEAKNFYASSAAYADIFTSVTDALSGLTQSPSLTPEQQTAEATKSAVDELKSINAVLDTIQKQQEKAQADQLSQMDSQAQSIKQDFIDALYEVDGASAVLTQDLVDNIMTLRSELADLIMNIDFTANLPDDLHNLMVMASNSFKVSVDLVLDPASTLTPEEKALAAGMTKNSVAMLKMLLDPASTLTQQEKNIATATLLNSTVLLNMAIDPASTWTSEEKEIALGTSHTYQALVDIQLSSASDMTAKALAMATSNTIDAAVKVALDPSYDAEAKQIALATANTINTQVKALTDQSSSTEAKALALNTTNAINATVKALMDPAGSAEAKAIALNNLNMINSMVKAMLDPTSSQDAKALALNATNAINATVKAAMDPASSPEAKALALATENTISTAVKVGLDPGYDPEAKQIALATTNSISALVKVATDQASSQEAKMLALNTENSINTVVKALMDPASSADAKAIALNNLNTINSMVKAMLDPLSSDTAKLLALETQNTINTAVKVSLDPNYDADAKLLALTTSNTLNAAVKVMLDPASDSAAKQIATETANSINASVKALMDPASSNDAKALAMNSLNTLNASVKAVLDAASSAEAKALAINSINSINASVKALLDSTSNADAKKLALNTINSISASVKAAFDPFSNASAQSVATKTSNTINSGVIAKFDATSSSDAQKVALAAATNQNATLNVSSTLTLDTVLNNSILSYSKTDVKSIYESMNWGILAIETHLKSAKSNSPFKVSSNNQSGGTLAMFAKGGITNKPSIFGEAGWEAAVPLPDGRTIPVTVNSAPAATSKETEQLLNRILAELQAANKQRGQIATVTIKQNDRSIRQSEAQTRAIRRTETS